MEKNKLRNLIRDKRFWAIATAVVIVAAAAVWIRLFQNASYKYIEVTASYENVGTNGGKYIEYAGGILEYSRDGIALLTKKGKELWNQPCQVSDPVARICGGTAVVADKGGTNVFVFQKDGLKGEIQTTRPIEKIAVSAQGVVAALLQDEENPKIMCYDARGNVLVELKASFSSTGYPAAVDLSQDGKVLIVSYIYTAENKVTSRVVFYNFGKAGTQAEDYQVAQKEYEDAIIPTAVFLDKDTALFVSDQSLIIYEGLEKPEEKRIIRIGKEIQSVAYDEKHVALLLKEPEKSGYELCMYHVNGKQTMRVPVDGEYTNMKLSDGKVLLFDESKCAIYSGSGVCKYEGALEMQALQIFAAPGPNKYLVISTNGLQEIQLVK